MNHALYTIQAWAANYWAIQGAPKDKIIVGVSFYGQTFAVDSDAGVGAPSSGPGAPGEYTGQAGTMAYYEVRISCYCVNYSYFASPFH